MTALKPAPDVSVELVEWRCDGSPNTKRTPPTVRYVPYISAATAADLLDEWVGNTGWSDEYEPGTVDGKPVMWCTLSIRTPEGEWVSHKDLGIPTQFEGQKGAVSDAFKRAACLKWGCGRNVYRLPTTWAPCRVTQKNGKDVAWPTDATVPHILAELKRLGYGTVEVTRLQPEDHGEDERTVEPTTGEVQRPAQTPSAPSAAPAGQPEVSESTAESLWDKAIAAGMTPEQIRAAVGQATDGRTGDLEHAYKSEVPKLRRALVPS